MATLTCGSHDETARFLEQNGYEVIARDRGEFRPRKLPENYPCYGEDRQKPMPVGRIFPLGQVRFYVGRPREMQPFVDRVIEIFRSQGHVIED